MKRHAKLAAIALLAGCASSAPRRVDVSFGTSGLPPGFHAALTGGGGPVAWRVRDDPTTPAGKSLVQESADDTSYRFPLCIYDRVTARDVAATVRFKAIRGTVDRAGGIVLRYAPENYYVARANALEDNVNVFKTVNGNRIKLAEVAAKVTPGEWHALGFAARGTRLTVTFDGAAVIELDDATFTEPGKVGLWTKADSVTAFDALAIETGRR